LIGERILNDRRLVGDVNQSAGNDGLIKIAIYTPSVTFLFYKLLTSNMHDYLEWESDPPISIATVLGGLLES